MIISPFSIWSLLLLLAEGSSGQTSKQLRSILRLPADLTNIRSVYKYLQSAFTQNSTAIALNLNQVLFFDINRPIDISFQEKLEQIYEADFISVNFIEQRQAIANKINAYIREKVKEKIDKIIEPDDLYDANMFLISAIFFQGRWKVSLLYVF